MRKNFNFSTDIEFVFKRNESKDPKKEPNVPLFKFMPNENGELHYRYSWSTNLTGSSANAMPPSVQVKTVKVKKNSYTTISNVLPRIPDPAHPKSDIYPTTYYIIKFSVLEDSTADIKDIRFCIDKENNMDKTPELYRLHKIYSSQIVSIESLCENSKLTGFSGFENIGENDYNLDTVFQLPYLEKATKAFKDCKNLVGNQGCNLFGSDETLQPHFPNVDKMYSGDSHLTGDLLNYIPLGNILAFTLEHSTRKVLFSGVFEKCELLVGNIAHIMGCLLPVGFSTKELSDCKKITPISVDDPKKFKEGLYVFQVRVTEQNKNNFKLVGFTINKSVLMMMSIVGNKDTKYYTYENSFTYDPSKTIIYSFPSAGEYIIYLYWCADRKHAPTVSKIDFETFNLNVTRLYIIEDEDIKNLDYLLNGQSMLDFNNEKDEEDYYFLPPALLTLKMPSLNNMEGMYRETGITSIPKYLFENSTVNQVINISYLFSSCKSLTDTPSMLFCKFIKATDFSFIFDECEKLTTIPSDLFYACVKADTFESTFEGCSTLAGISGDLFKTNKGVTTFKATFKYCDSITEIPKGLFANNSEVRFFNSTFQATHHTNEDTPNQSNPLPLDKLLEEIDPNVFIASREAINFNCTFRDQTRITAIPAKLFSKSKLVTDFGLTFSGCTNIKEIPAGLFDENTKVVMFSGTFQECIKIETIPPKLFDKNTKVTDFYATFSGCDSITAIPAGLFDKNTKVTTFKETFMYCIEIAKIPDKLFDKNTKVTTFEGTFYNCTKIFLIPEGLFNKNTKVTTFENTFCDCLSLDMIPDHLFDKNTKVTTFKETFAGCSGIRGIPYNFFNKNKKVTTFEGTFKDCVLLDNMPSDLFFKNPAVISFANTFSSCVSLRYIFPCLFKKNLKVESFERTFLGCESLSIVIKPVQKSDKFFATNTQAYNFESTFEGCGFYFQIHHTLILDFITFKNLFHKIKNVENKNNFSMRWMFSDIVCNEMLSSLLTELGTIKEGKKETLVWEYLATTEKLTGIYRSQRMSHLLPDRAIMIKYPDVLKERPKDPENSTDEDLVVSSREGL